MGLPEMSAGQPDERVTHLFGKSVSFGSQGFRRFAKRMSPIRDGSFFVAWMDIGRYYLHGIEVLGHVVLRRPSHSFQVFAGHKQELRVGVSGVLGCTQGDRCGGHG